jgi:hypothetical protein
MSGIRYALAVSGWLSGAEIVQEVTATVSEAIRGTSHNLILEGSSHKARGKKKTAACPEGAMRRYRVHRIVCARTFYGVQSFTSLSLLPERT